MDHVLLADEARKMHGSYECAKRSNVMSCLITIFAGKKVNVGCKWRVRECGRMVKVIKIKGLEQSWLQKCMR